ncbi:NADH-dependent flavin oxidoreductase [Halobacterium sp. DL1]|jgi:2,4-dienoyl-CoA reductase-like NADH-dependent reductase (Old Yellow Enzyme family)|nr:NADH-dependent flavin oxidoreductase [Halobacterium sp. DL1]
MPRLDDPVDVGGLGLPNRLYRAPLLECAGTDADTAETLVADLEPAAASGAGLLCQGATIVRGESGCAAPNMTRVHDDAFVATLSPVPEAIEAHGGRVFAQLAHGGLRSMEVWHAGYRDAHPDLDQLAVSRPPPSMRLADRIGFLDLSPHVLSTDEVYELAADFGRAAERLADAGYHGIHVAGANMGLVQQFLSPFYNRRDDEFVDGFRFLERLHDEVRARTDVPLIAKIPSESQAPRVIRRRLTDDDCVRLCERAAAIGFDAVVPVSGSVFWDMHVVRGEYPERAWRATQFQSGYAEAFGGPWRARLVSLANRLQARNATFEPAWNADLCRRVRERVDIPVMLEGGVRERDRMDRLLGDACDLVGMGRPFYAEPRLPARLLDGGAAVCENCNNCTVPQVTGAPGICRTPSVLAERGRLERENAYDRD